MNAPEKGEEATCPYFMRDMKVCGLYSDGIYMPPRAHAITYCLSSLYKDCSIYERYYLSQKLHSAESARTPEGRRRFIRIASRRKVLIRTCDSVGIVTGGFEKKASTVDYSQKGMRIVIEGQFPETAFLLFDFDKDFLIPGLQGIAALCWLRQHPDSSRCTEAGLEFKDHFSQAALSVVLED